MDTLHIPETTSENLHTQNGPVPEVEKQTQLPEEHCKIYWRCVVNAVLDAARNGLAADKVVPLADALQYVTEHEISRRDWDRLRKSD